jgi:hypothetical protein
MLQAPDRPPSDWLLTYGPWLLVAAVAGVFALVYARRAIRRRGGAGPSRALVACEILGGVALLDVAGLALVLRSGNWHSLLPILLAVVLLGCLIGLAGCGGYTVWRMIATVEPRTPSDPPAA